MEKVTGIGGAFFKARDPESLADWYRLHLGVPVADGQTYAVFTSEGTDDHTVWAAFPKATDYLGEGDGGFMINFRVANLDAMMAQLEADGIEVLPDTYDDDNGRFGWAVDPEGNRIELWEPRPRSDGP